MHKTRKLVMVGWTALALVVWLTAAAHAGCGPKPEPKAAAQTGPASSCASPDTCGLPPVPCSQDGELQSIQELGRQVAAELEQARARMKELEAKQQAVKAKLMQVLEAREKSLEAELARVREQKAKLGQQNCTPAFVVPPESNPSIRW